MNFVEVIEGIEFSVFFLLTEITIKLTHGVNCKSLVFIAVWISYQRPIRRNDVGDNENIYWNWI